MLLFTRKKILEREFVVDVCARLSDLDRILARGPVDVAVLCHSVPKPECDEVIDRLREISPRVKVLVLYETLPELCSEHSDKSMECLDGPVAMLDDLHALLREAAQDSARA